MAVENYKKISEMTGSASISDNNLIPFVKPGDSNNYIITYRELADEILNDAGVTPETYENVNQVDSTFVIDFKDTPYASIYLNGDDVVNTVDIINSEEGTIGKILVRQKGNKKLGLNDVIAHIDLPDTVDSMILITYFKSNGQLYAFSNIVRESGQQLAPETINDLLVVYYDANSVRLQWTAPNSIDTGTPVTYYDMRYSNNDADPHLATNWNSMKRVGNLPTPAIPGTIEYFNITNLEPNKEFYIYIKSIGNYNGINYTSGVSNVAFCKTSGPENLEKAYRIVIDKDQIFTVSDEVLTDTDSTIGNAIHLKGDMIDEESSNVFGEDGYPDVREKNFSTYHKPYPYSRIIRPYFIFFDLYHQYSMDRIYVYSSEKFSATVYGMKDIGYPMEEIGQLGNPDLMGYYSLDLQNKQFRYIILSQDKFNCIAGVTDNSQYSSAQAINNLLLYGRPVTDIPEKIHEPLRRSVPMRTVDKWFNINGHVYQNPDIHAISGGDHPRLYANYNRWTAWDHLHNYDSIKDFKYTLNTNPWIKNNNYGKVPADELMLQYKALGLKPFFCTFEAIAQAEYQGLKLKNLDDYWYPGHWRPQAENGIGGLDKYFEESRNPNQYRTISRLQYHLAARFGNNTNINPNTLNLEPSFEGTTETNAIGLGVLSGLEVENELDAGVRLLYHDPLEYAALMGATFNGNGDSLEDEEGNKWFGIKKADPSLLRIMPGIANYKEPYLYLGYLQLMANSPTKEVPFDVINGHWYSSSHIYKDNAAWSKAAYGVPLDIAPLSNDWDPKRTELNFWNFRDKHLSDKELWITEFGFGETGADGAKCKYQAFNKPGKMIGNWQVPDRHRSDIKGSWIIRTSIYFMSLGVNLANYYSTETEGNWYSTGQWGTGAGNEFHVWDHMNPADYPNPGDRYTEIQKSVSVGDRNQFNAFGLFGSILQNGAYPITHAYWWTSTFRNRLKDYVFEGFKKDPLQPKLAIACFRHITDNKGCYVVYYRDMINHGIENYPLKFPDGVSKIDHVKTYIPIIPDATKIPVADLYNPGPEWAPIIGPVGAVYDPDVQATPLASQKKVWNATDNKFELSNNSDWSWEQVNTIINYIKTNPEAIKGTTGELTSHNIIGSTYTINVSEFPEYYFFDGIVDPTYESNITDLSAIPVSPNSIKLYWNNTNAKDQTYNVFMSNSLETGYSLYTSFPAGSINEAVIVGLSPNTTYYFKIKPSYYGQDGTLSDPASAKTFEMVDDPTNLRHLLRTTSTIQLQWDWDENSVNNKDFSFYSYYIYRSPNNGNFVKVGEVNNKSTKTFNDTGLTSGTIYTYKIRVMGTSGNSQYSNILETRTLLPNESSPLVTFAETDKVGTRIVVTFDLPIDTVNSNDYLNFTLTESNIVKTITGISNDILNQNRIFLDIPINSLQDFDKRELLKLSYTKPLTGGLQSIYGIKLENINRESVVNNINNFTDIYATYRVNFSGPEGSDITTEPELWNNIKLSPETNITTPKLTDTYERESAITIRTINLQNTQGTSYRWGGTNFSEGTYQGPITEDPAIIRSSWSTVYQAQSSENYLARMVLSNLNPTRKYTIRVFGSNSYGKNTSFSLRHNSINSNVVSTLNNADTFAVLEDLVPDSNNQLIIDTKNYIEAPNYQYVYLQFMLIEEYGQGGADDKYIWLRDIYSNDIDEDQTYAREINVSFNVIGSPTHYRLGEVEDLSNIDWIEINQDPLYDLGLSYGTRRIYGQVKNEIYESNVVSMEFEYKEVSHDILLNSITINNGATITASRNVTVVPSNTGYYTHYKLSEDADLTGSVWIEKPISGVLPFTLSSGDGVKTIYCQLKNEYNETLIRNSSITLQSQQKIAISFDNDAPFNGINYLSTPQGVLNILKPNTNSNYTHKQLQDTAGTLTQMYYELASSVYPINSDSDINGSAARYTGQVNPILFYDDPYPGDHMDSVYTTNAGGSATRKARFALQLPVGNYTMKLLYSKNNNVLVEERRVQAWYRLDIEGVQGTPVNQFDAGVNTQNRQAWTREFNFSITNSTVGNVMLNMWSTANDQDSGLNFIEITKL